MLKFLMMALVMMFMNKNTLKPSMWIMVSMFNLSIHQGSTGKMSYLLIGDSLSFWITNMSLWVIMLILSIKMSNYEKHKMIFMLLTMILMTTFYCWNFLLFYIMFEMSMVMIIITVMIWGYQPERVEATMFMVIMTSALSLPFFLSLMNKFNYLNFWMLPAKIQMWEYLSIMFIFMVKLPAFTLHAWLPKLHVESPIQGSMILAAVMLKLGGYGMIRMNVMTNFINNVTSHIIIAFSTWSIIILSIVCLMQSDLKSMIAYSSIVHMGLTLAGISLTKEKGIISSVIIMLGHGMCSSALFFLCNQMYKNNKSRSMIMNKGTTTMSPTMTTSWFILCMMNAPMPPSINILGEILTLKLVMEWSMKSVLFILMMMMVSFSYSIIMFCVPTHGNYSKMSKKITTYNSKNLTITIMHMIPGIAMIIKSNLMMTT
uniref:NADH-ubiquinone oxidoreductase chain 4 n=1 Tax=Tetraleurodes acaciae TaxID=267835 RepID=Q674P5_TETAA|nr:NADH dehydrogenase subunit 4 [Tetraleurodes acaciae]AAU14154.1 NADH dehydrogenase subunit 4 [Tetraleurodes acaciae]